MWNSFPRHVTQLGDEARAKVEEGLSHAPSTHQIAPVPRGGRDSSEELCARELRVSEEAQ